MLTLRPIRSYVLRQGRLTQGQQKAFTQFWPTYGLPFANQPLVLNEVFGNSHPVFLEIGCGNGSALAEMALRHPERNYLGIEVHGPGVGHLLHNLAAQGSTNVRIFQHDAIEVLRHMIPDAALAGLYLFFPDPWHKKRHHKRRIVQANFAELVAQKLSSVGFVHMATDWEPYAEQMLAVLQAEPRLRNTAADTGYVPRPIDRPLTRFEKRGQALGHVVHDLVFQRCPAQPI